MARRSNKTPEELARNRREREEKAKAREAFQTALVDARRYRALSMESLLQAKATIEQAIESKKKQAIKELEAQRAAIDEQLKSLGQ
jgi:hypothetical protein